jgi:hypothetical protein
MWSQHVPRDHVHVITVPRGGPPGALWIRFASVLGADVTDGGLPEARVNSSLGPAEAEFLRQFNETLPDEVPGWFYTHHLRRVITQGGLRGREAQARLALPPGPDAWAREQAKILVAGLRDGKYHIVGDLDELQPLPPAGEYVPLSGLTADVRDAAVLAAVALAKRQYHERNPAKRGRRKPRGLRLRVLRLGWLILHGPRTRRLRVAIWRILIRPARFGLDPVPAGAPEDS